MPDLSADRSPETRARHPGARLPELSFRASRDIAVQCDGRRSRLAQIAMHQNLLFRLELFIDDVSAASIISLAKNRGLSASTRFRMSRSALLAIKYSGWSLGAPFCVYPTAVRGRGLILEFLHRRKRDVERRRHFDKIRKMEGYHPFRRLLVIPRCGQPLPPGIHGRIRTGAARKLSSHRSIFEQACSVTRRALEIRRKGPPGSGLCQRQPARGFRKGTQISARDRESPSRLIGCAERVC